MDSRTDRASLVDVDANEVLELQIAPADFTDESGTGWAALKVPGQTSPRRQWISGEAKKLSLRLEFYRLPDIQARVRWIESLKYPSYEGGMLAGAPHRVLFLFGDLYADVLWVVTSTKIRWFDLFGSNLKPLRAEVDVTLEEWSEDSMDYRSLRG